MTVKAYLTIDDSASERMDDLTSYLANKGIPALFFCRGDCLEKNPASAIRAVQRGFVLGNHTYSHQRSSETDYDWFVADIERCETILERIYKDAGAIKPAKYFRFPHVDRGTAGWVVDFDSYVGDNHNAVMMAFAQGLNVKSMEKPSPDALVKKQKLQEYLKKEGYTQPFKNVSHDWFAKGEIADAHDCLYTYSNCDWMVTARHRGKWPYKTSEDLKKRALLDPYLMMRDSVNVILAHDQAEILDVTIDLIEDLFNNGIEFLECET